MFSAHVSEFLPNFPEGILAVDAVNFKLLLTCDMYHDLAGCGGRERGREGRRMLVLSDNKM